MFICIPLIALAQNPSLDLTLMPKGLFDKIHAYAPFALKLSTTKPFSLKKAPPAAAPQYGEIRVGGQHFLVMFDGMDKLYVDTNGDGDLTDDPAPDWGMKTEKGRDGKPYTSRKGTAMVDLDIDGKSVPCAIGLYEFQGVGYYLDFAMAGKADVAGKSYDVIYVDNGATWTGKDGLLMVDEKADGQFSPQFFHPVGRAFKMGGKTFEFGFAAGKPAIMPSSKEVVEPTVGDPNVVNGLKAGKPALTFRATAMGGEKISFPGSYKGKVVMLDFWATWCHPCMLEVPNVAKNYRAFHDQGFDVLGVSLDRPDSQSQIKEVTAKNGMAWPIVYDGKFFSAAVAKQYKIQAIPEAYLVDGDTGQILASGDDIRGEKLGPAIQKALAAKKKK